MKRGVLVLGLILQLFLVAALVRPGVAAERSNDIKQRLSAIGQDGVEGAVAADEALRSNDPLLRSLALEQALLHRDARVRSIGFAYLVRVQKRLVAESTVTEAALASIRYQGDQNSLMDQLVLVLEFSDYDPNTGRFKVSAGRWGKGEGAIGLDGITITVSHHKMTLRAVINGYLVGTASYKLSNTPGLIHLPTKAALP